MASTTPAPAVRGGANRARDRAARGWRGAAAFARRVPTPAPGWPSVIALAVPVVFLAVVGWSLRWISDDGWINIRILLQTFAGNGVFTYNPGERVEAGTSTLWLALVSLLHVLLPWIELGPLSAGLGVVLTTTALVLATLAGMRVARRIDPRLVGFCPLGTAAVAALPPFWDFTTSGLETSLTFCWLATCYWLLVRRLPAPGAPRPAAWRPLWPALVIGLGWLVRPDAALYAVAFAVALLVQSRRSVLSWLGAFVAAVTVPAAYEVFRMGYFGALVPNTALAKDASANRVADGIYYLLDYVVPYSVWFPLLVGALLLAPPALRWARTRRWATLVTVLSPVVPAVLHAAYVVRLGGDFMHARFLLPPTFAALLPVAVIGVRRGQQVATTAGALVLGWCVAVAGGARVSYTGGVDSMVDDYAGTPGRSGVANEREFWSHATLNHHTLRVSDWRGSWPAQEGEEAAWDAALGRSYYRDPELLAYLLATATPDETTRIKRELRRRMSDPRSRQVNELWPTATGRGIYLVATNMGIKGVVAGPDVVLVDRLSLTDAIAARAKPDQSSPTRAGHRAVNPAWQAARYADTGRITNHNLINAREALTCGDLPELIAATTEPMTWARFTRNVRLAPRLTALSFPEDPTRAREQLCGYAPPAVSRP